MGSREVDGKILTLSASGWTYFETFVLWDYETESLWFPWVVRTGYLTSVSGFYADRTLPHFKSSKTTWKSWKSKNPDSKYMKQRLE